MKKKCLRVCVIFLCACLARAQSGAKDGDFLLVGAADLDGKPAAELTVCAEGGDWQPPMRAKFKEWHTHIGDRAIRKMFDGGKCQLISYDKKFHKEPLAELAAGLAVFEVQGETVKAVQKFGGVDYYLIVKSETALAKPPLKALSGCAFGVPANRLRTKMASIYQYHSVEDRLDRVGMTCDAAVLSAEEFAALKRKGLPKGYAALQLSGTQLTPAK